MFTGAMLLVAPLLFAATPDNVGYYTSPTLAGDTLVFVSEGDLWRVPVTGGTATRLTSHPGDESTPALSADGRTVAFVATYEGMAAVYTMPIDGGLPTRVTWTPGRYAVTGWTPDGRVLYASDTSSTLPSWQLHTVGADGRSPAAIPLAEASDGVIDPQSGTVFFTRLQFQGSQTKRYQGGTAQQIWAYAPNTPEAVPLTADWAGTSKRPMLAAGRVVFASDRDGTMNLWSMRPDGTDLRQHTAGKGWDLQSPSLSGTRVAYKLGADLHVLDLATSVDTVVPITLDSDLDQSRPHPVKAPMDWLTSWHLAPDGDRVVLTARGQVFVAPRKDGRFVDVTHDDGSRWRDVRFSVDGKQLYGVTDRTGEGEVWTAVPNGDGAPTRVTTDGHVLRRSVVASPDGKRYAIADKDQDLWIVETGKATKTLKADSSPIGEFVDLAWSPDGRWLAYVRTAENFSLQIWLYDTTTNTRTVVTTERADSYRPVWSPDGKWLTFLSDRNLASSVGSPWGPLQPEPFYDKRTRVYQLALHKGDRSPFAPADELHPADAGEDKDKDKDKDKGKKKDAGLPPVTIDLDGLAARLWEVPVPAGNLSRLSMNGTTLFWCDQDAGLQVKPRLYGMDIGNDAPKAVQIVDGIDGYELSADGKRIGVQKGDALSIVDAKAAAADLSEAGVDLSAWTLQVAPAQEWRQMYDEAWRLERDYFWDTGMSGTDWKAIHDKYAPLVDRVRARGELSDVLAQMISELSTLHEFVYGGDFRAGPENVVTATLGATTTLDVAAGGWRVDHIYRSDPDEPRRRSPLAAPGVEVQEGDVITRINGQSAAELPDPSAALRNLAGHQVLLHVKPKTGVERDVIVYPLSAADDSDLRYLDWEVSRRDHVEAVGKGQIGYVHLRAMGTGDMDTFVRSFYPQFNRAGLVIDVRHNRGGNIDSWVLERLSRKVWMFWSQRVGRSPNWNMQYGFRGHIAVLCDQRTASDGEAFTEGFKRLGLGRVFGMRTWGGEIWLSSENVLVDNGIATAAEFGVYGPEGGWLVEGHGAEPDQVVDNLPHATCSHFADRHRVSPEKSAPKFGNFQDHFLELAIW